MAQTGTQTETVQGRVEQTNEKGLKVDGRWFNWSQYSRVSTRPQEGDDVELEIARGKFINDARILDSSGSAGQGALGLDDEDSIADGAAATRGPAAGGRPAPTSRASSATPNADRNTEIRRLALTKAAADYAAARGRDPEEVVTLASRWEEWVTDRS